MFRVAGKWVGGRGGEHSIVASKHGIRSTPDTVVAFTSKIAFAKERIHNHRQKPQPTETKNNKKKSKLETKDRNGAAAVRFAVMPPI